METNNSFDLINFEQLRNAFVDVLENGMGYDWQLMQDVTGLSAARCKDICKIFNELSH